MFTQPITRQIQWQDVKVKSEVDIVFDIAHQKGWKDCEIFGNGDMILQPLESKGWKLVPADLYEYSIPPEGADRVLQIINAGVRIKGVIIADDKRRTEPTPARQTVSLPSAEAILSFTGKALLGLLKFACVIVFSPLLLLGRILDYDPKLVILVDDGNEGTVWISILTWYD